jgi:hypothetical protein
MVPVILNLGQLYALISLHLAKETMVFWMLWRREKSLGPAEN